ncbi:MAG: hypothetical protein ABL891_08740 [Burkholderiales bacterium]
MLRRVTIDTNCINVKGQHPLVNALESLAERGMIKITSTFALAEDLRFDHTKLGEARRLKASRLPQARSGFMVGHSKVGGPDVVGGPNVYAHVDAIANVIAPMKAWQDIESNTQRDILHLAAHRTYDWDIFITEDKGILRRSPELALLGIRVMSPQSALDHLVQVGIT